MPAVLWNMMQLWQCLSSMTAITAVMSELFDRMDGNKVWDFLSWHHSGITNQTGSVTNFKHCSACFWDENARHGLHLNHATGSFWFMIRSETSEYLSLLCLNQITYSCWPVAENNQLWQFHSTANRKVSELQADGTKHKVLFSFK